MGTPVQWHTEGRRQPSLIGKDPAGKPLWGGPYTTYQGAAIVLALIVTWGTRWLWGASLPSAEQLVIAVGVAAAASYGAGRIDYTQISPIWNTIGWTHTQFTQLMRPRGTHTTTGRARRAPKPQGRHTPPTWVLDFTVGVPEATAAVESPVSVHDQMGHRTDAAAPVTSPALAPVELEAAALEDWELATADAGPIPVGTWQSGTPVPTPVPTPATAPEPSTTRSRIPTARPRPRPSSRSTRNQPSPTTPDSDATGTDTKSPDTTSSTPTSSTPTTYTRTPELQTAGRASGLEAFLAAASSNRSPR